MINRHPRNLHLSLLRRLLTRLILTACLLSACALPRGDAAIPAPEPVTLTIAGSTEMRPLLTDLTSAYSERNPHVQFTLFAGGSRMGERRLASGQADIAASTAAYPDAEIPAGLVRIPIGLDGIAVIVHTENPVEALTLAQIRALFGGSVLNWEEVGGAARDVLLVSREDGSATRELFEERVMDKDQVSRTAVVMSTSSNVLEYVAGHRDAIGYVTFAYLSQHGEKLSNVVTVDPEVKAVSVEGRVPFGADLANYQYSLARALYLLFPQSGAPLVQNVIDFARGEEGQAIIARYHVPVR
ncbi:MAG: phosphate ABC transporter substrate-binding protein [Caldilineaceae bacterium SB0668_bin_21]|nr:phosphate ABC transporter substrate-binding protein [Caldilineaceae bacterium SB0668_bin_21]MYC23385.1 phosphate ABC transporter substrate-binding protein [Caldilineaceae bacterium SB0662_bin_25]